MGKVIPNPVDWVKQPSMPPRFMDFNLDSPFEDWRFRVRIPKITEFSKLLQQMASAVGTSQEEAAKNIDNFLPSLAEIGALLTTHWNFVNDDGEDIPVPNGDVEVINQLPSDIGWSYLMKVSEFFSQLQSGGREEEAAKKF